MLKRFLSHPPRVEMPRAAFLLVLFITGTATAAAQPADTLFALTDSLLHDEEHRERLPNYWKYHPRDSLIFAQPTYDASNWPTVNALMLADSTLPPHWNGLGWFRLRIAVDSVLQGRAMGLRMVHFGASEVYLDGERILSFGEIGTSAETTENYLAHGFRAFTMPRQDTVLFAVRYADYHAEKYNQIGYFAGFYAMASAFPNVQAAAHLEEVRTSSIYQFFFLGAFGAFALLHLALFVFYREAKEYLYFALFLADLAGFVFFAHQYVHSVNPDFLNYVRFKLNLSTVMLISVLGPLFVYALFDEKRPRHAYGLFGLCGLAIAAVWVLPPGEEFIYVILAVLLLGCAEMLRVAVVALYRHKEGARILSPSVIGLALTLVYAGLIEADLLEGIALWYEFPFFAVLVLATAMSVYLGRRVGETNRDLRKQLAQVRALSEEKLEEERRRERMRVEYERKLQELEDARRLQLSMLPERVPEHPELEIAVHMETAEEVGGDYYDFAVDDDGALTLAIGDATGHGLKASTMVTAMKSLFNALGREKDVLGVLRRSTKALKEMNLQKLYMALALAKFTNGTMRLAAAGMPPALLYRAATGEVETIELKGMPLGSFPDFPYDEQRIPFGPGDTIFFMSDGFPERFNAAGEMIGYDAPKKLFEQVAGRPPQVVIDKFIEAGRTWSNGTPPDDDVTFVVVRRRKEKNL